MSASSDKLRICYPEFASVSAFPDATLDFWISKAANQLEATVWLAFFEDGSFALAAHMLAMSRRSAAAAAGGLMGTGPVNALRTGDEQITFGAVGAATAKADEVALRQTIYGLEFLRLKEMVSGTPLVAC